MNIDKLVERCYDALPGAWRRSPWSYLDHGRAVLDSDDKLNAYIASYGEMHILKCRMAMRNLPFDVVGLYEFEIFDWGCGQGIGTLTFLEFLAERDLLSRVRRINLIEPSEHALNRAKHWISNSVNPHTEIRVFSRFIPSNESAPWNDIDCSTRIAVHICSNILDIRSVGLRWLANTTVALSPEKIYICVGPLYDGTSRITDFYGLLGTPDCFTDLAQMPCGYTSQTKKAFGIEAKCFRVLKQQNVNSDYVEQSEQEWVDEYVVGEECLRGVIPNSMFHVYKTISQHSGGFEVYLKPSIGIERPDFLLANISKGILILNVCDNIENLGRDLSRVESIKQAFFEIYIKRLKIDTILNSSVYNSIKTGLYFTNLTHREIDTACTEYYQSFCEQFKSENPHKGLPKDPTQYLVKLCDENVEKELMNTSSRSFRFDYYEEITKLIFGKWHFRSQGDSELKLSKDQQKFVDNDEDRLRVRGVAGSGKTQVIAYKAVKEHLRTEEKVLIITFNISLIEYIKMRINQVPADFSTTAFDIINYHQFFGAKAKRYSSDRNITAYDNPNFFKQFKEEIIRNGDQYSTIIIDEAQDFMTEWIDVLRKYFLKSNGRLIIFGDGAQNIYGRELDESSKMPRINGFGDEHRWRSMGGRISMRTLNPEIAQLASEFAKEYELSSDPIDAQGSIEFDMVMRYWKVDVAINPTLMAQHIIWVSQNYHIDMKDIVVLGQSIYLLRDIDDALKKLGYQTMTTFESMEDYKSIKAKRQDKNSTLMDLKAVRRVSKVHFTTNTETIKLSTIPSFKGWESKTVVLLIQKEVSNIEDCEEDGYILHSHKSINALLYTGITRARENLFIFNLGNETYHDFFESRIKSK